LLAVNNWTKPIKKVRNLCKSLKASTLPQPSQGSEIARVAHSFPPASDAIFARLVLKALTPTQREIASSLHMLHRTTQHQHSAEINQVLLNMELLAFALVWFSQVHF
jgi:hypothetical protein